MPFHIPVISYFSLADFLVRSWYNLHLIFSKLRLPPNFLIKVKFPYDNVKTDKYPWWVMGQSIETRNLFNLSQYRLLMIGYFPVIVCGFQIEIFPCT